nr:type II toxin-antitoxin system HicA family toxin [Lactobacillus sp. HBUAS51381]
MTFADAKRFLEHYGCVFTNNSGGSHYAVKHSGIRDTIILPRHAHQALKRYNVSQILEFVDKIEAQEEDK